MFPPCAPLPAGVSARMAVFLLLSLRHFEGEQLGDGCVCHFLNKFANKDMDILGDRGGPEDIHQVSQGKEISPFTKQNSCAACGTPQEPWCNLWQLISSFL